MKKSISILLLCGFLLNACTILLPGGSQVNSTEPGSNPTDTAPLYEIPAQAWTHGIGVDYPQAGKAKVNYPMIDDGAWAGVPLGGLGAGAIGRTYRGDFARWHLDLGTHRFEPIAANQFSVYVEQDGQSQAHVLSAYHPDGLKDWNWDMPAGAGTYAALFPKAWFVYDWKKLPVELAQLQFSPVIPNNYQESSYPVGVFEWKLRNPGDRPLTVSLMFTWQNLVGHDWGRDAVGGNINTVVQQDGYTGIVFSRKAGSQPEEWDGTFAILTPDQPDAQITYRGRTTLIDHGQLWQDFSADGRLDNSNDPSATVGESILGGLAVEVLLQPGEEKTIPFTLAWDFPITEFGSGRQWYKRYTAFYGTEGDNAFQIAADALKQYPQWLQQIDAWQQPILADTSTPDWYKTALFNELYYLVDGGTVWEAGQPASAEKASLLPEPEIGHFAYLECYDYLFYNTFDVGFYASYALAHLWPEIEKGMIRDFAAALPLEDPSVVTIGSTGQSAQRKTAGMIPHDLGSPNEDPWQKINAYNWQNINIWKDLNSKFALQVWRDYVFTKDESLVMDLWPQVRLALDTLKKTDTDNDGLPDHSGVPDQTYDTWPMKGDSAYSGSLWLAALEAAIRMGGMVNDSAATQQYTQWLTQGKSAFESKLWTGTYYRFDASGGPQSNAVMADQLAGQWYAGETGLDPIVPADHAKTALQTIFKQNVQGFQGGKMGAVNGTNPDGSIDTSGEQSQEVWTGVTYALAALMRQQGMEEEAWQTAYGAYNMTYNRGYWFRTPEAWDRNGNFRASLYMRPLAVWALQPPPQ